MSKLKACHFDKERSINMTKEFILQKLTSRKLWVSIASFVSMILIFRGSTEGTAESVASIIMAGGTMIAYLVGEGLIDQSRNVQGGTTDDKENIE